MKTTLQLFLFLFFSLVQSSLSGQCTADWTYEDDGLTITFVNQSTSQNGDPIVSYLWDFGDGESSTESNPVHTYADSDEYLVCLTITTQNGCTDQLCAEVEHCLLTIDATVGEDCDENNEITLNVTINDIYDQARDINVFLDDVLVPGSPFEIRDDEPVILSLKVPGDGQLHTLSVQSIIIDHCTAVFDFTTFDCASGCFLNNMSVELTGGTMHTVDVGGNFFSPVNTTIDIGDVVRFNWIDGGHSTTSDATSGPDSWNSGVIGNGSIYDVILTHPGVHPYYCIPHGGPGGAGMSGQIIANCPPSGAFDVIISFNTSVANPAGYNLLLDGVVQPGSPFSYTGTGQNTLTIQLAGDGINHTVTIEDVNDPTCSSTRMFQAPDCGAAPTCTLSASATQTGSCDAQMNVPVQIVVSSINGGASGFNVLFDGTIVAGPISYDGSGSTTTNINTSGDGLLHTITIQDIDDATCQAQTTITTTDCTIPCALTGLTLATGSSFTHLVEVQDFQFAPQTINISSGDNVQFVWTGQVAHTATSDIGSGPDSWDSGILNNGATFTTPILSEGIHPYYCIPHGAPGGVGMSGTITVQANCTDGQVSVQGSFNHSGVGINGYQILVDGVMVPGGPFIYDAGSMTTFSVFVPGDGLSHEISIQDQDNNNCSVTSQITTPDCNASTCQLTAVASQVGACNNGQVGVEINIQDVGGGLSGFQLWIDGAAQGSFLYTQGGSTVINVDIAGDGQDHTIEIVDIDDPSCTVTTMVTTTDCTIPCAIENLTLTSGNSTTHTVEVLDFDFNPQTISITSGDVVQFVWTGQVAHTSTSDAADGPDSWDSGLLNNGATFTTPVLSEGIHPYYCIPHGAPGGVGMAGSIVVQADCTNGEVSVQLAFQSTAGGPSGYHILIDGVQEANGPFPYDENGNNVQSVLVPGDGGIHTVLIQDADNPNCSASATISTPDCNASTCQLSANAELVGSCQNDSVAVQLTIQDIGGSENGFSIFVDDQVSTSDLFDPSGTTTLTLMLPGDGMAHEIVVIDATEMTCQATTTITTTDCALPCILSNLSLNTGSSTTHIVEVRDFDFSPQHKTITSGDLVEFSWTGQVAHTSTSDASAGPDSWDSGLLNQGASFTTQALSVGVHPYYCIPHGAPGGVGMSGTITVQANCTDGMVSVNVSFEESGGGIGFEVLVDNVVVPGGPFSYDASGINSLFVSVIGDGSIHEITVRDIEDATCVISGQITTPDCDASTCQLSATAVVSNACNDQQMSDIEITVQDVGGTTSGFQVFVDGELYQTNSIPYDASGTTLVNIQIPGDGNSHSILIQDVGDATCLAATTIDVPDCSQPCSLFNLEVGFNEAQMHIIEVRDFSFFPAELTVSPGDTVRFFWTGVVAHTTTSDATTGSDVWDSGLLGEGSIYDVVIETSGVHPYYCIPHGAPGGVGMAGVINSVLDCDNGIVQGTLSFETLGTTGNTFHVLVDDSMITGSPFMYSASEIQTLTIPLPGDGQVHQVQVYDSEDNSCSNEINITTPSCDTVECSIELQALVHPCTDSLTSTVTLNVVANAVGSSGFQVLLDGIPIPGNPFMYDTDDTTTLEISVPGDGGIHQILVYDIDAVSCQNTVQVMTPDCQSSCTITNLTINYLNNTVHEVEVRDFEFSPKNIEVSIGDTVRFVWTGVIPHTTTSDATSGVDIWDSGLLTQGAVYDVVIQSAGMHPYYCIPHGAPGGIGMAGTILANETCENQMAAGLLCIDHVGISASGFQIYIDSVPEPNGPFQFEADGNTCVNLMIPADGATHHFQVIDLGQESCTVDTSIFTPDCEDACFGFEAGIEYVIDNINLSVQFDVTTPEMPDSVLWQFGDGNSSTSTMPTHIFENEGAFTVCLVAYADECIDTSCVEIYVGQYVCEPAFIYDNEGLTVNFLNQSMTTDSIAQLTWVLGDGQIVNNQDQFVYTYDSLGVYEVCLTIQADTCSSTYCETIDLSNPCLIFDAQFNLQTEGNTVTFTDQSIGDVQSWLWGFGDGQVSSDENPVHVYESGGSYTVCLSIFDFENNCTDYTCLDLSIVMTSLDNTKLRPILIYPNPTSAHTQIQLRGIPNDELDASLELFFYDITGRLFEVNSINRSDEELTINLPDCSAGTYVLHVQTKRHRYIGKIVIQN